ncbi:MAG: thioesterase family protein [Butyricicoccus sp.]|nr:thioesterase family protein [Butyricicoccus sp.]
MIEYVHKVQYYETDRMGVTHHSNYIRWMEEARVAFLDAIGWNYARLEEQGVSSPVVSVQGDFKNTTTFDDSVVIGVRVKECSGVKLVVSYEMHNQATGQLVFTGTSSHCFLAQDGKIIRLQRSFPEFYQALQDQKA